MRAILFCAALIAVAACSSKSNEGAQGPTVGCGSGPCATALVALPDLTSLAVDSTYVYFTRLGLPGPNGTVEKISKLGGTPVLLAGSRPLPMSLSVDRGRVYWSELADATMTTQEGGIFSVPVDGGAATTVIAPLNYPLRTVVRDGSVFYTAVSGTTQPLYVQQAGPPNLLYPASIAAIAVQGGTAYWATQATVNGSSTQFYNRDAVLYSWPLAGGPVVQVATGFGYVGGIAVKGDNAFITEGGSFNGSKIETGSVLKVSLTNGLTTELASGRMQVMDVGVDATGVYWTSYRDGDSAGAYLGTGSIRRVPISGGPAETLFVDRGSPLGLYVDTTTLFFILQSNDSSPDRLMRLDGY